MRSLFSNDCGAELLFLAYSMPSYDASSFSRLSISPSSIQSSFSGENSCPLARALARKAPLMPPAEVPEITSTMKRVRGWSCPSKNWHRQTGPVTAFWVIYMCERSAARNSLSLQQKRRLAIDAARAANLAVDLGLRRRAGHLVQFVRDAVDVDGKRHAAIHDDAEADFGHVRIISFCGRAGIGCGSTHRSASGSAIAETFRCGRD